jgi:hypothetical protein
MVSPPCAALPFSGTVQWVARAAALTPTYPCRMDMAIANFGAVKYGATLV